MITDKDREELIEDLRAYNDAWVLEEGKDRDRLIEFESAIRAESAEQARKDADEKLATAVKALKWAIEYIGDGLLPEETPDHECGYTIAPDEGYCEFCENYWNARDALKEIQG